MIDQFLRQGSLIICGPVAAELMTTIRAERRGELKKVIACLEWVDLLRRDWELVGEVSHALRGRGETVALTDIMIAVACTRSEAELWTWDTDFQGIAAVMPQLRFLDP